MATTKCLTFLYNMHGSTVGILSVFVETGSGLKEAFNAMGDHRNNWLKRRVTLPADRVRVIFKALRGVEKSSTIAIDGLTISDGACPPTRKFLL